MLMQLLFPLKRGTGVQIDEAVRHTALLHKSEGRRDYRFRHSTHEAKGRIKAREQTKKAVAAQVSETVEEGASPDGSAIPTTSSKKGGPTEASTL